MEKNERDLPTMYVLTVGDSVGSALVKEFRTEEEAKLAYEAALKLGFPVLMLEKCQLISYDNGKEEE